MNIKGKKICDNCFSLCKKEPCEHCGYKKSSYHPEIGILPVGTVLKQRYCIGLVLGKGGFGVTYKAYDMRDDRVVAIKEYYPNGIAHRDTGTTGVSVSGSQDVFKTGADKFFEEAKTVSRFNGNPNIVGVFEFFYENNTVYYVMEYLEGMDLKAYIRKNGGKLSEGRVMSILNVITDALIITHSLNVLHRDISPDNIYILNNGGVKLIDFGAARYVVSEQSKSLSVILKQGFAPLEQYQRRGKQGPWTDIYALGATCYYALTGKVPDDATERIEEPSIGEAAQYGVDEQLWSVIEKCLAIKTSDRYQSIAELKADLAKVEVPVEPLAEDKSPEDIPMTVMGSGEYAASGKETIPGTMAVESASAIPGTMAVESASAFPGTVAVSADNPEEVHKETHEDKQEVSPVIVFLKSKKGIISIAAFVGLAFIITAVTLIASGVRKNRYPTGGDVGKNNPSRNSLTTQEEDTTPENQTDPTTASTTEPTTNPTTESTTEPTTEPTTEAPTQKPTEAPTQKPTEAPTQKPTEAPTQKPTEPATTAPQIQTVTNKACSVIVYAESGEFTGTYTGEWKNGKPNGKGTFLCSGGVYYKGTWSNGTITGKYAEVRFYLGDGKSGNPNVTDWSIYQNESFEIAIYDSPGAAGSGNYVMYTPGGKCQVTNYVMGEWVEWNFILDLNKVLYN